MFKLDKKDLIYVIIIISLITILCINIKSCSSISSDNKLLNHNIEALSDTIKYYTGKNNELIAEKKLLVGDNESLKLINSDLSSKLESMKIENAEFAAQIDGFIKNPQIDTIFCLDSIYIDRKFEFPFDFSNKYRALNGTIDIFGSNVGLNIKNDIVYFDYTIAIKDNTIYLTSDNPYVKTTNTSGIILPKQQKRWTFGIQAGIGAQYNLINSKFGVGPYIGAGLTYNIGL